MIETQTFERERKKAHELNCNLAEEGFNVREIEIIGYYLNRIAASYLSHQTHKEIEENENEYNKVNLES